MRSGEEKFNRGHQSPDFGHEHDRVLNHVKRVELFEAFPDRWQHDFGIEQGTLARLQRWFICWLWPGWSHCPGHEFLSVVPAHSQAAKRGLLHVVVRTHGAKKPAES